MTTNIAALAEAMESILRAFSAAGTFMANVIATDENRAACYALEEGERIHIHQDGQHVLRIELIS